MGREAEAEEIRRRLLDPATRLLTLTGPGGTGKTRLSLQVAADSVDDFDEGVFFVPLAEIDDPALVPDAIALALDVREEAARSVCDTLVDAMRNQQVLLVLDNLEQVTDCAPFVGDLLRACPRVKLLITSRIPLRVYGEREHPVPPLGEADAVRLFVERARAARPDFSPAGAAARAVAEICARVDYLPLAVELAAARIRLFTPEAMLARMEQRLPLLTEGARDLPARQQTLRNLIAWSWDLLDTDEKTLFRRLGVFRGGFSLDAAETVAATPAVRDGITSLVEKSLLRRAGEPDEMRYEMLQTVHEFAREQLEASDEAGEVHTRHAGHFLAFVEESQPKLYGAEQVTWLNRLEADHDDLRAAISWTEQRGDLERALRFGAALWGFWRIRGHFHEGRAQLDRLLCLIPKDARPSPAWAQVCTGAGALATEQGHYAAASTFLVESLAIWQALGDERRVAGAFLNLGNLARHQGDTDAARAFLERSLEIWSRVGSPLGTASALTNLGLLELEQEDPTAARPHLERSLAIKRDLGNQQGIASALINLADAALDSGDTAASGAYCAEAVSLCAEVGDRRTLAEALEACACLAASTEQPERTLLLGGAAAALREAIGAPAPPPQRARLERWLGPLRAANQDAASWNEGTSLTPEAAAAYALSALETGGPSEAEAPAAAQTAPTVSTAYLA